MGKKKKIDKNNDKTVKSINNGIRSSVRKINPILKSIVGKKVDVAIRDLQFSEKRVTRDIRKTISSAELIVFLISLVTLFSENCRSLIATSTFLPTILFKIGLIFLTLDLIPLFIDFTVLSLFLSIFFFLPIIIFSLLVWLSYQLVCVQKKFL